MEARENLHDLLNQRGAVMVASSRSGATEVVRIPDGRLFLVEHLKSGRDEIILCQGIPDYLTVRYDPPSSEFPLVREFVPS